jgi:Fe-S cluster assembly protein SufD
MSKLKKNSLALVFVICLLCVFLCGSALAEETDNGVSYTETPVYVDGLLSCRGYMIGDDSYVSLEAACAVLGYDADVNYDKEINKLTVEVAGGAALRLVVLHTKPCQAEIRIKLLEGADAELVQLFSAEAFVDFQVEQAAGSKFRMTACQFTSANVRYRFDLNGREASNELDVLFLALEQDHCVVDLRTNHLVPDCTSRSLIKGVASGTGRGEFCGLVYVAPDAQHTDAQQQCRNILLSRTSRIDARPQLEIYADDVRCSHGATVGQMEDEAILYMRQRGLKEEQARRLQIEGFAADVVGRCRIEAVKEILTDAVVRHLDKI